MAKSNAWPSNLLGHADFDGPDGCWVDPSTTGGYGQVTGPDGLSRKTHRTVWTEFVGSIPDGYQLHHLCHTRACFHPDHLVPMDVLAHTMEHHPRWEACSVGHPFDQENTYIRKDNGERQCRRCHAIREQERKAAIRTGPEFRRCSECGLPFRLRKDGMVRAHFPNGHGHPRCPGVGRFPA